MKLFRSEMGSITSGGSCLQSQNSSYKCCQSVMDTDHSLMTPLERKEEKFSGDI